MRDRETVNRQTMAAREQLHAAEIDALRTLADGFQCERDEWKEQAWDVIEASQRMRRERDALRERVALLDVAAKAARALLDVGGWPSKARTAALRAALAAVEEKTT